MRFALKIFTFVALIYTLSGGALTYATQFTRCAVNLLSAKEQHGTHASEEATKEALGALRLFRNRNLQDFPFVAGNPVGALTDEAGNSSKAQLARRLTAILEESKRARRTEKRIRRSRASVRWFSADSNSRLQPPKLAIYG